MSVISVRLSRRMMPAMLNERAAPLLWAQPAVAHLDVIDQGAEEWQIRVLIRDREQPR